MFEAVKNLYLSPDLPGECLLQPFKKYYRYSPGFFSRKGHSSLDKLVWTIVNLVANLVIYPFTGVLVGVGMLVKLTGIPSIKKHNDWEKTQEVENIRKNLELAREGGGISSSQLETKSGVKLRVVNKFDTSQANIEDSCQQIRKEIDRCTSQFRKIFLSLSHDADQSTLIEIRAAKLAC